MSDAGRLIVHAGAPKCGSSALQTALSRRPDFAAADGTRYAYCTLSPGGALLTGDDLARRAARSPFGYMTSPNHPSGADAPAMRAAAPVLARLRAEGGTPILSSESWVYQADRFRASGLLAEAGGGAHVIIFIRPPIDWINSAWWQWGVWSAPSRERFLANALAKIRWHKHAAAWSAVEGVERVSLRLAGTDVVGRFFDMLDARAPAGGRENSGVPPALLGFLLRNRSYRDNAHAPQVEFIVARHLRHARNAPPWVISQDQIRGVFEKTRHLPKIVRGLLPPEDRALMKADPRWWSPEAYTGHAVTDLATLDSPEALIALHGALMAPIGAVGRVQLAGSARRLRQAARQGDLAAADTEIARVLDWILAQDFRRRMGTVRAAAHRRHATAT